MSLTILTIVVAVLGIVVLIEGLGLLGLYFHFSQTFMNSRDGRWSQGPEVDKPLKATMVTTLRGEKVHLPVSGMDSAAIVFVSTSCSLCGRLRDEMASEWYQRINNKRIVFVCAGKPRDVETWARSISQSVVADPGHRVAAFYGVTITPFLVAYDRDGTAQTKGVVNSAAALESALELVASANGRAPGESESNGRSDALGASSQKPRSSLFSHGEVQQ